MKIYLNIEVFEKLQGKISNKTMAKKLKVSRSQLWRAKSGEPVGEKFIAGFKEAFPSQSIDRFFLTRMLNRSGTCDCD